MSVALRLDDLPLSRFHWKVSIVTGVGTALRAMNVGIVTFVLASLAQDWKLSPKEVGTLGSVSVAGMAFGVALIGSWGDKYGRRTMFNVVLLVFSVGSALCGLAWNYLSLLLFRLFTAVTLGGGSPINITIVSEFSPSRYRGRMLLALETFWVIGYFLAALVAYLVIPTWGWRAAFFVSALSLLYLPISLKMLPESPRFLVSKGRRDEAERVIRQAEIESGLSATEVVPGESSQVRHYPRARLAELFTGYRRRTLCLWILWFTISYVYYGLFVWLPSLLVDAGFTLASSFEYALVITFAQIPGTILAGVLVDKVGRKRTIVPFLFLCALASYFLGFARSTEAVLFWGSAMAFFNLGAWGVMTAYTAELYPTRLRSTGVGWAGSFGRTGGVLAPVVTGFVLGTWGGSYELVFVVFALVSFVAGMNVALLGEETVGRSLEELNK
ncbi:MAG: MFS transporter [Chloroflexi bacterium]|nr:MFS transporter [Chloroflexota bacterium]